MGDDMSPNGPDKRPVVALVLGDPTGIGPEICARALADNKFPTARIVVVGDARVLEMGMRDAGVTFQWVRVRQVSDIDWSNHAVPVIDLANTDLATLKRGQVSDVAGQVTGATLAAAIEMAKAGQFDAISFAPLNKQALWAGGWKFPDEHKMFAHLLGHNGYFSEMNVLDGQWMGRVTGHVSLREALDLVTAERIEDAIRLADRSLRRAGREKPRIAVAALNPHAGEGGLFGREEIELIRPTVEAIAATGIDCQGPFPADSIYIKAFEGAFDSVVSMYHDQGQIATKLKGFNRGVTVTAGLQIIFTTPAHGTAFDIVGTGQAKTGALETAVALAAQMIAGQSAPNRAAV